MPRPRMPGMNLSVFGRGCLWVLAVVAVPAQAARPFMTDDARITTAGSCQVESWHRAYRDRSEFWAMPACNPTGNFEITAGVGRFRHDGQPGSRDEVLQGKTLFRPLTTNDWAWGLAVGGVRHPGPWPGPNQLGTWYAYVPVSISRADDRWVTHLNLGVSRDRASGREAVTWGSGVEYWVHPRLMAVVEGFGDDRQRPFVHAGWRWTVRPGLFQVDATVGQQPGVANPGRWWSFGLRYTPDKLF